MENRSKALGVMLIIIIVLLSLLIVILLWDKFDGRTNKDTSNLNSQITNNSGNLNTSESALTKSTNTTDTNNITTNSSTNTTSIDDNTVKKIFKDATDSLIDLYSTDLLYDRYNCNLEIFKDNSIGKTFCKSNTLYKEVQDKYSLQFTGEALNKLMDKFFLNVDGYLFVSQDCGGRSGINIQNIYVTKVSDSNGIYSYNVKYDIADLEGNIVYKDNSSSFTFIKSGDKYLVSKIDFYNII